MVGMTLEVTLNPVAPTDRLLKGEVRKMHACVSLSKFAVDMRKLMMRYWGGWRVRAGGMAIHIFFGSYSEYRSSPRTKTRSTLWQTRYERNTYISDCEQLRLASFLSPQIVATNSVCLSRSLSLSLSPLHTQTHTRTHKRLCVIFLQSFFA